MLCVSLFGGCRVTGPGGADLEIANKKARALIAFLAISREPVERRETLASLLWSNSTEHDARASLRQCLRQIRLSFMAASVEELTTTREAVAFGDTSVEVDLTAYHEWLGVAEPVPSLLSRACHPDRILQGYDDLDPSLTAWIGMLRRHWEDRYTGYLRSIIGGGDADAAIRAAELLIAVDPTHEEAHRALICAHADAGNVPAALRQYKGLWDVLGDDYDMEPDDSTQSLIAAIKSGTYAPTIKRAAPPSTDSQSLTPVIALGKFIRGGPWKRDEHLISGLHRDLIAALVRFRDWVVVEEPTNPLEEDPAKCPDYVIEGSFYEEDDRIHLVFTLKDNVNNRFVWSERVEPALENWPNLRRELVRKIAASLNIYLSVDTLRENLGSTQGRAAVYARWLNAQACSYRWRPQDEREAEEELRRIIRDEPRFAPAYSSLVQIMNSRHHVFPGRRRSAAEHRQALDLARKAVELDPLDCRTQLCLAWSYAMNAMYPQAAIGYRLAYRRNENDLWTIVSCGLGLAYCDFNEEACKLEQEVNQLGLELSPLHWAYRAGVRFICGDYKGCVEAADLADDATFYLAGWRAAALTNLGEIDAAQAEADRFLATIRANWHGEEPPRREDVAAWFLEAFPIRSQAVWEALRNGLSRAGISAANRAADHLQWAKV